MIIKSISEAEPLRLLRLRLTKRSPYSEPLFKRTKPIFRALIRRNQACIRNPYSERLHLIQKAKLIDLLLLTLPHFGNVLFRGIVISVNWSLCTQLYHYNNTIYFLCLLVKLRKFIYIALVSYPLASLSNSTMVLPLLYVLIISFGMDPYKHTLQPYSVCTYYSL